MLIYQKAEAFKIKVSPNEKLTISVILQSVHDPSPNFKMFHKSKSGRKILPLLLKDRH